MLQTKARKSQVPIDSLSFEFTIINLDEGEITAPPREGVYIKGLFLEGGGWDFEAGCLCEPEPMELIVPMPLILFKCVRVLCVRVHACAPSCVRACLLVCPTHWLTHPPTPSLTHPALCPFAPPPRPVENKKRSLKGYYSCPMYMYPVRTGTRERPSYQISVDLRTGSTDADHWIMRGTALLLSLAS